jgi:hypothetical protein
MRTCGLAGAATGEDRCGWEVQGALYCGRGSPESGGTGTEAESYVLERVVHCLFCMRYSIRTRPIRMRLQLIVPCGESERYASVVGGITRAQCSCYNYFISHIIQNVDLIEERL